MSKTITTRLTPSRPTRARTLRLTVPVETAQAAARIGRDYSGRRLETVLSAFVGDMAAAAERPGCWEHERVTAWLSSHVWECEPAEATATGPRLRDHEVMGSVCGAYPWDAWEKHALARGVAANLATLGRAVIREAWQHGWDEQLKALCGWHDDGRRMLRLALRSPARAAARWQQLLNADGGRYIPQSQEGQPCR